MILEFKDKNRVVDLTHNGFINSFMNFIFLKKIILDIFFEQCHKEQY